jgi:hypothetical protein
LEIEGEGAAGGKVEVKVQPEFGELRVRGEERVKVRSRGLGH